MENVLQRRSKVPLGEVALTSFCRKISTDQFYTASYTHFRFNHIRLSLTTYSVSKRDMFFKLQYSGTPPYDHPVYKTTSLLRPYCFKPNIKNIDSFYYFEDPVNATTSLLRPEFYGPTVVALTGFHCSWDTQSLLEVNRIVFFNIS